MKHKDFSDSGIFIDERDTPPHAATHEEAVEQAKFQVQSTLEARNIATLPADYWPDAWRKAIIRVLVLFRAFSIVTGRSVTEGHRPQNDPHLEVTTKAMENFMAGMDALTAAFSDLERAWYTDDTASDKH
jgi:hypothetical protein